MISSGNRLASTPVSESTEGESKEETRMFKFGELQVELTREKAYIDATIGFVYGIISWELSQGIQNIPESSFQYANENALLIAQVDWGESTMMEAERLLLLAALQIQQTRELFSYQTVVLPCTNSPIFTTISWALLKVSWTGNKVNNIDVVYTPSRGVHYEGGKRINEVVNRLNRTKVERKSDLKAKTLEAELDGWLRECGLPKSPDVRGVIAPHAVIQELKATGKFHMMDIEVDEAEHSMEMHLPYLAKVFREQFLLLLF
ncbi:hypothetical protein L1887_23055 [Cichorium endivia]|nr:hypothetical protein L1887_23055 [Cichorium endivia]